jgi:hypothetical protein
MKQSKTKNRTVGKRQRQALELQVSEYIERYHPEFGEVAVDINPSGTLASVREVRPTDRNK